MDWRKMRIIAAACWKSKDDDVSRGLIFTIPAPARHHDIIHMMAGMGIRQDHTVTQGFLTDTGDFVRRKPALMIAENAGQLIRPKEGGYQGDELFSEDLW